MTQYTPAQARELADTPLHMSVEPLRDALRSLADQLEQANLQHIAAFGELQDAAPVAAMPSTLFRENMLLKAQNAELERLCEATYVATGADAYNHATDCMEQWQAERVAAGKDPGTTHSLCDGMDWLYARIAELEDAAPAVPAPVAQLSEPPEPTRINTASLYFALQEAKLALIPVHSGASIKVLSLIDALLSAAPTTPKESP